MGDMFAGWFKTRQRKLWLLLAVVALGLCGVPVFIGLVVLVVWTVSLSRGPEPPPPAPYLGTTKGMSYVHETVRRIPWSIHVVKIERSRKDLELHSMMGRGTTLGMATISDQTRMVPREWGTPVAAVNGDLFYTHPSYRGDPEGLQVVYGELVSAPSLTRVCFWLDSTGNPHRSNVVSRFAATWPDGSTTRFGLNEARRGGSAVLYTAAVGASTRARGGLELLLEREPGSPWLPLQIGQTYTARVREVSQTGNTPLTREVMVLSVGPDILDQLPDIKPGAVVKISTATVPDLAGSRTALGGGPTLVAGGWPREWDGLNFRHPRTAIGWNRDYFFLVEVDGRQFRLSAGMSFSELAEYMVKLGCEEAMNLDGGGSATCWVEGHLMNSPSQGGERPSANGLVVLRTNPPSP